MTRRLTPLTGADVASLPGTCAGCLFWELGTACPDRRTVAAPAGLPREDPPADPVARKAGWISARVQEGRPPGRLATVDGEVAGYALFGPGRAFARRRAPAPPVSQDALLLATVLVRPVFRERGIGRLLVQAAVREAVRVGATGVEAYGDRRWRERSCALPATWLLHEGFEVRAEHPRTPLLRLDVRRAVRWAGSLEHALEEVLGRAPRRLPGAAPERAPRGATFRGASGHRAGCRPPRGGASVRG